MKKIWKFLGIAAVAASVPLVFRTNRETGEKTVDAVLWQLKARPNQDAGKHDIEINLFPNRLSFEKR